MMVTRSSNRLWPGRRAAFFIAANGNVGFGTSDPAATLEVKSSIANYWSRVSVGYCQASSGVFGI